MDKVQLFLTSVVPAVEITVKMYVWKSCKNYDASFSNGQFPLDNGHGDCINKDKTLSFVAVDTKKPASAYAEVVSFIWVYILERDLCL